jgi:hypothetical protein
MMRFIAPGQSYRAVSRQFVRRIPDDVWADDRGWYVSYELVPGEGADEEVALFQLRSGPGGWGLESAVRAQHKGEIVTVTDMYVKIGSA